MERYTYLIVELCTILVPFVFSFHPRLRFDKELKYAGIALLATAACFIVWDGWYTHWNVWGFNPHKVYGVYAGNLPLEEVFFFLIIPYACLFSYHCFKILIKKPILTLVTPWILTALQLVCISGIIFCYDRLYTVGTCVAMLVVLLPFPFKKYPAWMPLFLFTWVIMLIPFFLVNGVLTGTGLDAPVVWYNDNENLGLRMSTIPVEDIFYGMSLILLNVRLYEWVKAR